MLLSLAAEPLVRGRGETEEVPQSAGPPRILAGAARKLEPHLADRRQPCQSTAQMPPAQQPGERSESVPCLPVT